MAATGEQVLDRRRTRASGQAPGHAARMRFVAICLIPIVVLLLTFCERNPGITRLLTGDALTGETDRLRSRVQQLFDRLETELKQILREAERRRADLIVVGVHGRGALDRLVFGSTADRLVRLAACPVLTIRSDARK